MRQVLVHDDVDTREGGTTGAIGGCGGGRKHIRWCRRHLLLLVLLLPRGVVCGALGHLCARGGVPQRLLMLILMAILMLMLERFPGVLVGMHRIALAAEPLLLLLRRQRLRHQPRHEGPKLLHQGARVDGPGRRAGRRCLHEAGSPARRSRKQ